MTFRGEGWICRLPLNWLIASRRIIGMKVEIWLAVWAVIWLRPLGLKRSIGRLISKWSWRSMSACHGYYLLGREGSMIAWVYRQRSRILLMNIGLMNIKLRAVTIIIVIWTVYRRRLIYNILIVIQILRLISPVLVLWIIHLLSSINVTKKTPSWPK